MSSNNDSQQYINEYIKREDEDMSADEDSDNRQTHSSYMLREQDRFLPICNIIKIMKIPVPENGKIAKDARECIQECVSEFISFITSEAIERSMSENRKTVNGDDLLYAFANLGFDNYVEPLSVYLHKFREATKCDRNLLSESSILQDDSSSDIRYTPASVNMQNSTNNSSSTSNQPNLINENSTNIVTEFEFQLKDTQKPPLRTYFNKNSLNSLNSANILNSNNSSSTVLSLNSTPGLITTTSSAMSSTSSCSSSPSPQNDHHESLRNFRKNSQNSMDAQNQILNSVVTTQANDLTTTGLLNPDHMIIFNTEELMQQVSQQQQQLQQQHHQQQQQHSQNSNQQPQQQQTTQIFNTSQWPQQIKEENDFCQNFVF